MKVVLLCAIVTQALAASANALPLPGGFWSDDLLLIPPIEIPTPSEEPEWLPPKPWDSPRPFVCPRCRELLRVCPHCREWLRLNEAVQLGVPLAVVEGENGSGCTERGSKQQVAKPRGITYCSLSTDESGTSASGEAECPEGQLPVEINTGWKIDLGVIEIESSETLRECRDDDSADE